MNIKIYPRVDFLSVSRDILQSDEARYGLIYGIALQVAVNLHHYGEEDPWFCTVGDSDGISALGWRTPPYLVGLAWYAGDPKRAVSPLIEAVRDRWQDIPGVTGHREITDFFMERWCQTYGVIVKSTMVQRIYRLDEVNDLTPVPGRMRLATLLDEGLVVLWAHAFQIEIFGTSNDSIPELDIIPSVSAGEIYLWEDNGKPVSMVRKGRPVKHGMAIVNVYTPPELRCQGYATACVAEVCKEILKSGYEFCTLYTDLSNPTSNSIYMKVGFNPVCDSVHYTFSAPIR